MCISMCMNVCTSQAQASVISPIVRGSQVESPSLPAPHPYLLLGLSGNRFPRRYIPACPEVGRAASRLLE